LITSWPPLPPSAYAAAPAQRLPFPLEEESCRLFELGRHALYVGARACGFEPGDEILVPEYHHGAEIQALASAGLTCVFYPVGDDLQPVDDALDAARGPRTRGFLLIHYFGIPQDGPRWRQACDERGLLLFEDVAQGWPGQAGGLPLGASGHVSIFCLYKTFGLPDGAALWFDPSVAASAPAPDGRARSGVPQLGRKNAVWLAQRVPGVPRARHLPFSAEAFSLGLVRPPSHATMRLLRRTVSADAAARRRENYEQLRAELSGLGDSEAPAAPEGAAPFVFPFATRRKEEAVEMLRRSGVRALDFWSMSHPSLYTTTRTQALRRQIVGLPVHQELPEGTTAAMGEVLRRHGTATAAGASLELRPTLDPLPEWNELATGAGSIFATWDWCSTWWRHFGRGRDLAVVACRAQDGRLKAILPLYQARSAPVAVVRFVGYGTSDVLRPICAPRDVALALAVLRRALAQLPFRADVFIADQLPEELGGARALGGERLQRIPTLSIDVGGGTWDDYLRSRSTMLQRELRRRERRLAREHAVAYRLANDPATLHADLDTLFDLHARRWGRSAFLRERSFHEEFAPRALEAGWLRLWIQEIDGEPSAAWYGFRFAGAESFYQSGWDPRWASYSVGFLLLLHTIRTAIEDGAQEYRFLRGGEGYKWRLANDAPGVETVGVALSSLGSVAVSVASYFGRKSDGMPLPAAAYRLFVGLAR
jgi:CelD/BcsL family acetyltransferase involved in cellulose biosynthesis/dTDP-4-amino-4,6-dideoxygalactose transaminase